MLRSDKLTAYTKATLLCLSLIGAMGIAIVVAPFLTRAQTSPAPQASPIRLVLQKPLERELAGGQVHSYELVIAANKFVRLVTTQQGIDVVVRLLDAQGKELAAVDSPNGDKGDEVLFWVAKQTVSLRVEVKSLDDKAAAGKYRIEWKEVRKAEAKDEQRIEAQRHIGLGNQLREQQKPETRQQAIKEFEAAAKIWSELGETQQAAHATLMSGLDWGDLGQKEVLFQRYEQAARLYDAAKDVVGGATSFQSAGLLSHALGDRQKAIDYYKQVVLLWRSVKDQTAEAHMLANIGGIYHELEEQHKALDYFGQVLALLHAAGDKEGEARTLNNIGGTYSSLGEKTKALGYFVQALPLLRAAGDHSGEASVLNNIGEIYAALGERQKSLEYSMQALSLFRAVADRQGEATTLKNIGVVYSALGEGQKAVEYYEQALPLQRIMRDRRGEAQTLMHIGLVYLDFGEQQKALEYYGQALLLVSAEGDRGGKAKVLNSIGLSYVYLGEQQKAMESLNESLLLVHAIEDRHGEASVLNNIGLLYKELGEMRKALDKFVQALSLYRVVGDHHGEANTLSNIAATYREIGAKPLALEYFGQALPLLRSAGDQGGVAGVLNNMGVIYTNLGERQKAIDYFGQSLPLWRSLKMRRGEAATLNNIGRVYSELGESQKALEYYGQSLQLARAMGDHKNEAVVLGNISSVWDDLHKVRSSISADKLAVNLLQQLRGGNRQLAIDAQQAFLRSTEDHYTALTDRLLIQGRLVEALQAMHLARDQEFYDQTKATNTTARPMELTSREKLFADRMETALNRTTPISQQLTQLQARINTRQPSAEEAAQLKQLNAALDAEVAAFQQLLPQLLAELEAAPEAEARLTRTEDLTEMQQTLRVLQQRTGTKAAAVYAIQGKEECRTLLVTADTIMTASAKINPNDLARKVQALLERLQNDKYDPQAPGLELYNVLFKPIEVEVQKSGATLLLWSLDRNLRALPMAALWDGKQYLAERYQHAVFTRPTPERMLRDVSRAWTGQGFGTSKAYESFLSLPGVGRELELVFGNAKIRKAGVLNGQARQDESFTKQALLEGLQQRQPLVHIASHFKFTPGDDMGSFLLLGNGEHLTLAEMKQNPSLFAGVELLTLSACNTATQKAENQFGREVDSFAEQAQRLGAGAVLASLWEVSDASTPELMSEFYRLRQSGAGMTKAAALQKAQLTMMRGEGIGAALAKRNDRDSVRVGVAGKGENTPLFKPDAKHPVHPYYWAPFILIGNWR